MYRVYLAPDRPTDLPEEVGSYTRLEDARKAAKGAAAGVRGASECGPPACGDWGRTIESYADRDGGEDGSCAWIEQD